MHYLAKVDQADVEIGEGVDVGDLVADELSDLKVGGHLVGGFFSFEWLESDGDVFLVSLLEVDDVNDFHVSEGGEWFVGVECASFVDEE